MYQAIGVIELKSIAKGIEATDAALKSAGVSIVTAHAACPGKYEIILTGSISNVTSAVEHVKSRFDEKLVDYSMPEGFEKMARLIPTAMSPADVYNFARSSTILAWPQQEAVITYSLAYQMFGDEKYKRLAKLIEEAAEEYFCDPDEDRWYLNIQISDPPARERKEKGPHTEGPFHFERMLIAMDILLTDGSIKRYIS